jgi:hypothetical protein
MPAAGTHLLEPKELRVGDYVWLRRHVLASTLQTRTMAPILRVHKLWPQHGVATLMGKCGRTIKAHVSHCARCNLPGIDPTINPSLQPYQRALPCEVCADHRNEATMLLCDGCGRGWHNMCLHSPLDVIPSPEQVWVCPECIRDGVTEAEAAHMRGAAGPQDRLPDSMIFPDARTRTYQAGCAALDGRVAVRRICHPASKKDTLYWGVVHYRGIRARPEYFEVRYEDGDTETLTMQQLKPLLRPPGAKLPSVRQQARARQEPTRRSSRQQRAAAVTMASGGGSGLLLEGMPGHWPEADLRIAAAAVDAYLHGLPPTLPYTPLMVDSLIEAVELTGYLSVLDPFGECGAVAAGLTQAGIPVTVGTRAQPHRHCALADSFYDSLPRPPEAVVTAPWPDLLDAFLPIAVRRASRVVCCLVPLAYLSSAPGPRRAWLARLWRDDRLLFVHLSSSASSAVGAPSVWLVIAATAVIRKAITRPYSPGTRIL